MRKAQGRQLIVGALWATLLAAPSAFGDAPGAEHRRAADVIGGYTSTHIVVRISADAGARFLRYSSRAYSV